VDIVPLPDFLPDWTLWVIGPPVLAMLIFARVWQVRDRRRQNARRPRAQSRRSRGHWYVGWASVPQCTL